MKLDIDVEKLLDSYSRVLLVDDWLYRQINHERLGIIDWTIGCENLKNASYRKGLKNTSVFEGIQYAPLKPNINYDLQSEKSTPSCLVYLGGGVQYYFKELSTILVDKLGFEKVQVVGGCLDHKEMDSRVSWVPMLSQEKFNAALNKCSFFICAGGWSMYEALNLGIPVGVILRASNSVLDVCGAISNGYATYVGSMDEKSILIAPSIMVKSQLGNKKYKIEIPEKLTKSAQKEAKNKIIEWLKLES